MTFDDVLTDEFIERVAERVRELMLTSPVPNPAYAAGVAAREALLIERGDYPALPSPRIFRFIVEIKAASKGDAFAVLAELGPGSRNNVRVTEWAYGVDPPRGRRIELPPDWDEP